MLGNIAFMCIFKVLISFLWLTLQWIKSILLKNKLLKYRGY